MIGVKILAFLTLLVVGATASAEGGRLYASVDWLSARLSEAADPGDVIPTVRPNGIAFSVGYLVLPVVSVEARLGMLATQYYDVIIAGERLFEKATWDYAASLLLKTRLPMRQERFVPYALGGVSRVQGRISNPLVADSSVSGGETSLSYGAGIEFWLAPEWGAKLEVIRYYDGKGLRGDAAHAGILIRF